MPLIKNIKVEFRNSYGKKLMYPVCPTAMLLCKLANKATVTDKMYFDIRRLGYTVTVDAAKPLPKEITWVKLS